MNGSNNAGGKLNLSGTYGLGLDMEPWAYEVRGRRQGHEIGRQEGYSTGYSSGYSSGMSVGNDEGLISGIGIGGQIAWNRANAIIENLSMELNNEREDANRLAVSMSALRRTVETLIEKNPKAASYIRRIFRGYYEDEVGRALKEGEVRIALHLDPTFKDCAPKMNEFLKKAI